MDSKAPQRGPVSEAQIETLLRRVGPRPQPSAEAAAAVRETVRLAWRDRVEERRRERRRWVGLAAAASVVLAVGMALLLSGTPERASSGAHFAHVVNSLQYRAAGSDDWASPPADGYLASGDTLRLGADSYAALLLDNGVALRLDADTELQLQEDARVYLRRGALYADAAGPGSVTVMTDSGSARDIGTRFAVRVTDTGWHVQVRDGRVVVDDRRAGRATATAGERLLAQGERFARESVGPADASWTWTHAAAPPRSVDGSTLDAYLQWWSAESGLRVSFEAPIDGAIARQTRLHGSLEGLSLEEGFQAILAGSGYRVVDRDDQQVILTR